MTARRICPDCGAGVAPTARGNIAGHLTADRRSACPGSFKSYDQAGWGYASTGRLEDELGAAAAAGAWDQEPGE